MSCEQKERLREQQRIIVFIGPEGSGKTTHALRLAEEIGKPYITTGDIIRDLAENDSGPLGDECRQMFATHSYLAGETLLQILVSRFSQADTKNGLVLDGGLRTLEETEAFQTMLEMAGRALPLTVIYLQIPEAQTYLRLIDGPNARRRKDDTPEGISSRLAKFQHQLNERLAVISGQESWTLLPIDATAPIEETYQKILAVL